jgi:hypothetical protein
MTLRNGRLPLRTTPCVSESINAKTYRMPVHAGAKIVPAQVPHAGQQRHLLIRAPWGHRIDGHRRDGLLVAGPGFRQLDLPGSLPAGLDHPESSRGFADLETSLCDLVVGPPIDPLRHTATVI